MKHQEEESLLNEVTRLDKEIEKLIIKQQEYKLKIKELIFKEDPSKGISYHKEVFELQQKKLATEVEIEYMKKKKNRILWTLEEKKLMKN